MNIQKPCPNDCMIVGVMPSYENLEGVDQNVANGHWLHHIVLLSSNKRGDPTCQSRANSLPHWVVGMAAASSERWFASGNERTTVRLFDRNITDVGYRVSKSDTFAMIVDLMNMNKQDGTLYVVMTYDYIEGKPAGMMDAKPVWLDVDQCGFSEAKARSQTGAYSVTSVPWRANVDGDLVVMGGHIHDGGIRLKVKVDGKEICNSQAGYGESPEYRSPQPAAAAGEMATGKAAGGHGHSDAGKPHISSMILCWQNKPELKIPQMKTGQMWTVEANYDYKERAGATHPNGQQENVMGIAVIWVKVKNAK